MEIDRRKGRAGERRARMAYYLDEGSILVVTVLSVLFSKAFRLRTHGHTPHWSDVWTGSLDLVMAIFSAVGVYGAVHTGWKYSDARKAPWLKRALAAVAYGATARVGWEG